MAAKPLTLFKVQARLCTIECFIKRCVTVYVTSTTRHGQALVLRRMSRQKKSLAVSAKLTRSIRTPCQIPLDWYKRRSNAHRTVCTNSSTIDFSLLGNLLSTYLTCLLNFKWTQLIQDAGMRSPFKRISLTCHHRIRCPFNSTSHPLTISYASVH